MANYFEVVNELGAKLAHNPHEEAQSFDIPAALLYADDRTHYGTDPNGVRMWRSNYGRYQITYAEHKEKETKMTEDQEFLAVTIYLSPFEQGLVRDGACSALLRRKVQAELPAVVDIEPGDIIEYNDSVKNQYEIVEVGERELIIRQLKSNTAGTAGSTQRARRSKVENGIRTGFATIINEFDEFEDDE